MAKTARQELKFKGQVKSKDYVNVKTRDYGIKSGKSDRLTHETIAVGKKKNQVVKPSGLAKSTEKIIKSKKRKAQLVKRGASSLRKAVIVTSIKTAAGSEHDESTENIKLTIGNVYHTRSYMKEVGKNYQHQLQKQELEKLKKNKKNKRTKKQPQSKKQRERELTEKKSRERHKGKVIDRTRKAPVKDIQKSKQLVKAKHGELMKKQTSRYVKKVAGKKAGVQLTAGTIKGLKIKAMLLKIGLTVVSGAKVVALKFFVPIGIIGIALILIVAILVAIVGITASIDPAIPLAEEVLVTEIHVHLTELDIDWNNANGTSIRTDSSDVIALLFMGGGVDPEREDNEAILTEVSEFHRIFHKSGSSDVVRFLETQSVFSVVADDFLAFREFAFIHFYGTLGEPYEGEWREMITSHFGWRPCPFGSGNREMHNGIDIGKQGGTPVLATISGIVQFTGYDVGGYGNWVMIVNDEDEDNVKETRYAHLHAILVSRGQRVEIGDTIGLTGTTGSSTGDHLHHEFRRNGNLLNPYFYFPNENLEMGIGGDD